MFAQRSRHTGLIPRFAVYAAAFLSFVPLGSFGQEEQLGFSSDGAWRISEDLTVPDDAGALGAMPKAYRLVAVDPARLDASLGNAADKSGGPPSTRAASAGVIELPMPDGSYTQLEVWEDSMLSFEMQAEHPHIKTYSGRGIDDPTMTAVLSQTALGFHGQLIGEHGTVLIDPLDKDSGLYMSFWKHDAERTGLFECGVEDMAEEDPLHAVRKGLQPVYAKTADGLVRRDINPIGGFRRTYNLRVVTTKEYTSFAANPVDRVTTTINRVRGIYEREVGITFVLVGASTLTGSSIGGCDYPFADNPSVNSTFLDQNHDYLECRFGLSGWDIGHVFGAGGGGGLADRGSVCSSSRKGRGGTQLSSPQGDRFDVDYVAHEIGHQFNATHTFNGDAGSCADNRVANSAYEPGSGSTIMAYADICGGQNVQGFSDDYFHTHSFDEITSFIFVGGGNACGSQANTGNTAPNINAGPNYTIPMETPFRLSATASDPDGDPVTVAWEQRDLGGITGNPSPVDLIGPLFRSRPPSSDHFRTFPNFQAILSQLLTPYEVLPAVPRALNFRATARDGRGGVRYGSMAISVLGNPFRVTYPIEGTELQCGVPSFIAWDVGGGSVADDVRLDFSSNNGSSFSTVSTIPNIGSTAIDLPKTVNNQARVMLTGAGNIFFSVSRPFSIVDTIAPDVTAPPDAVFECTAPGGTPAGDINIGTATATDVCATGPLSVQSNAPAFYPLGDTEVEWRSTDPSGNTGYDYQNVKIEDTTPPVVTAPPNAVFECTTTGGTPANEIDIGMATAVDVCTTVPLDVFNDAPGFFPLGDTTVEWWSTDPSGNTGFDYQNVKIEDTIPPILEVSVTPNLLWPPNHQMVRIRADIFVEDICDDNPTVELVSITANEPDNSQGDGFTVDDVQGAEFGTDDREFFLRAERRGIGNGRTYTITYRAYDASGNTAYTSVEVRVPRNQ